MSKHRHTSKARTPHNFSSYPSAVERQVIIQKRRDLFLILMRYLAEKVKPDDPRYQQLIRQYSAQEINILLETYQKSLQEKNTMLDEPYGYRIYRQAFARFGGTLPFLSRAEHDSRQMEFMELFVPRAFMTPPPIPPPSAREKELYDLILTESNYWQDITPPAIPPRPASYPAPQKTYSLEIQKLLELGPSASFEALTPFAENRSIWQPLVPELLRLVFDESLLHGWPGESSAWAPWHALYLLGLLKATTGATALLELMNDPEDWLSDRLPTVWAKMGPQVAPQLWMVLDDQACPENQRAQVCFGLLALAKTYPFERDPIVIGLTSRLADRVYANPSLNAYIIHVLDQLKATLAHKIIANAFKQNRVNTRILGPGDVEL